jgi:hypothetical protein
MATLTATFHDRTATERAIDDLTAANIPRDDISIVMSNETRTRYFGGEDNVHGANIAKGAASGGVIGGSLGAIAGGFLLGGAITVATGGIAAPFLIAGPIAGALAGGGAGAAGGSIVGAIVAVRADESREPIARAILTRDGGDPHRTGPPRAADTLRDDTLATPITADESIRRQPIV